MPARHADTENGIYQQESCPAGVGRLLPADRGLAEQPECDATARIEENREPEGEMVAAGEIEAPPCQPRAGCRAETGPDGNRTKDGAEL